MLNIVVKIILSKENKYKIMVMTILCVNFKTINAYLTELSPLTYVLLKIGQTSPCVSCRICAA